MQNKQRDIRRTWYCNKSGEANCICILEFAQIVLECAQELPSDKLQAQRQKAISPAALRSCAAHTSWRLLKDHYARGGIGFIQLCARVVELPSGVDEQTIIALATEGFLWKEMCRAARKPKLTKVLYYHTATPPRCHKFDLTATGAGKLMV